VFDRLSVRTSEKLKSQKKRKDKKTHLVAASINMIGRGKDSM